MMLWLYKCCLCSKELVTESAFTGTGGPPAKEIECMYCEMVTMVPLYEMTQEQRAQWVQEMLQEEDAFDSVRRFDEAGLY